MKAYRITDLKYFMNKFLLSESFDYFLLEEGTIVTFNTFRIDGHINKEFYEPEEREAVSGSIHDFSLWKDIRPLCFQLIKGKRTPLRFQFVLLLLPEQMQSILYSAQAGGFEGLLKSFTLTVRYDGSFASLITGVSTHSFLMDKTPEQLWDKAFLKFMNKQQLSWEEL